MFDFILIAKKKRGKFVFKKRYIEKVAYHENTIGHFLKIKYSEDFHFLISTSGL